jgi:hypothetical protein
MHHCAHGTFVARQLGVVGVYVDGLGESAESDQEDADER